MITFVIGLVILIGGGLLYGKLCEKLFTPDDVTHNIGIRMISRICTGMEYNYVLGLNVLTITVREGAAA